jgi:hypothetical protein
MCGSYRKWKHLPIDKNRDGSAIQWAINAPPPASRSEAEETQLRGRTNSPCHCFARALKAQRSLKTMDVMSVCITVKRQGTP